MGRMKEQDSVKYIEFVEGQKYPTAEKRISYDLNEMNSAGYVIKSDEIIIDIDDLPKPVIDEFLRQFNIQTETRITERGVHLYFKKPRGFKAPTDGVIPLGFRVEYKIKSRDHWITVKLNNQEREVLNKGLRADLPEILKSSNRFKVLLGLADGDGRNKALHALKFSLSGYPDQHKILAFVNDYIFEDPLPTKEFELVTRDEKYTESQCQEVELAKLIIAERGIVRYNKEFYSKDDKGNYSRTDSDALKRIVVDYTDGVHSKIIEEVFKQIGFYCEMIEDNQKVFPIKFENGFLLDGKFYDFELTSFTPYHVDIKYLEDAQPIKAVDDYLDFISHDDPEYRKNIEEIIGYCFNTKPEFSRFFSKFFLLYGSGSNGKGTFLRVIEKIVGAQNCSFLSHTQLAEHFGLDNMIGKLVNIGDDIPDKPFNDSIMKMVKNISSADPIQIDRKNAQPLKEVVLTTTLLFSSNHKIKSFEKGESFRRRIVWLPVDRKPDKADPHLLEKLTSHKALEYWVSLAIKGYLRLCENEQFTPSEFIKTFNENYHKENNNTLEFCSQLPTAWIVGQKQCDLREKYENWCSENEYKPLSMKVLKSTLEDCGFTFAKSGGKRLWKQTKPGVRYDPFTKERIPDKQIEEEES